MKDLTWEDGDGNVIEGGSGANKSLVPKAEKFKKILPRYRATFL